MTVPGIIVLANAILGLILFEWAWSKTKRFRNPNKDLNKVFSMFERKDAAGWAKWKFYPGAITLLLPRLIFAIVTGLI